VSAESVDNEPADREEYGPARPQGPFERGTDGPRVVMTGVDGSRTSLRAAAYAAGLARRQHATLVVVFVAVPSVFTGLAPPLGAIAVRQAQEQFAAELREECRRRAEELSLPMTFLWRRGDAYTELRDVADEVRADLVVVGSSAQAGHRLVGSIAARLVRAGRWPVLVVP
jgi:nucleotide-binding universal stress UspA family protein